MYKMDTDTYVCDCCGREYKWDGEEYGNIWECEECGKHFCTDCFTAALGRDAFDAMVRNSPSVLCQDCYKEELENLWSAFGDVGIAIMIGLRSHSWTGRPVQTGSIFGIGLTSSILVEYIN